MAKAKLHIENRIYCELDIESTDIPPTNNLFDKIVLSEGLANPVPTLTLQLYDQSGHLSEDFALVDGSKISITLGRTEDAKTSARHFRVMSNQTGETSSGHILGVKCLYDCPSFSQGAYVESYKGSSSNVLQQVASKAGLKFEGTSTSDDQVWINMGETRIGFTDLIAMHGYASASSCMARTVTSNGVLRYKNLFEELDKKEKVTFYQNRGPSNNSTEFGVRETRNLSVSGITNSWINYGLVTHEHSLDGKMKKHGSVKAPKFGQNLPINSDVKGSMEQSRIEYAGVFDSGNQHAKYHEAYYQNLRFLNLFSERYALIVEDWTDLSVMDPVRLEHVDIAQEDVKRTSGKFLVIGKETMIKNGVRYAEMIIIARPYVNTKGKSSLT